MNTYFFLFRSYSISYAPSSCIELDPLSIRSKKPAFSPLELEVFLVSKIFNIKYHRAQLHVVINRRKSCIDLHRVDWHPLKFLKICLAPSIAKQDWRSQVWFRRPETSVSIFYLSLCFH